MAYHKRPELEDLIGKCVVVQFATGVKITGFLKSVKGYIIGLFVAGKMVWIPLYTVMSISEAEGQAC